MRLSAIASALVLAACSSDGGIATNELDGGFDPDAVATGGGAGLGTGGVLGTTGGTGGMVAAGGAAGSAGTGQAGMGQAGMAGGAGAGGACGAGAECMPGETRPGSCDGCSHQVCGPDCTFGDCELQAGNECDHMGGSNWRCCATGSWQFCLSSCMWSSACEMSGAASCCTGMGPRC